MSLYFSPPSDCSSLPSTMTWAPCPHGVRTRGKKRLLTSVDLCNSNVEEIPEFTFVHCTSLREVLLPPTLHTIRVKAFMNLVELAIPPSLKYIGSRAFLDCTAFKRLAKMPGRHKWRESMQRECFCRLSRYEVATLAAHDPGHGMHPWSWMKTSLSDHSYRGLTVTHQESGRAP